MAFRWRRTRSAATKKATRKAAMAAARPYLTGEKVRRYESPKMIAQHGRAPWPAKKAAAEAARGVMRAARVGDRYPTVELERHNARKAARRGKSHTGGTWSLRKAGVGRSKTTGRFTKR